MQIDVNFNFTSDTPNYWDNFWQDDILGGGGKDPDSASKTLQLYHSILWSKPLPNGETLELSVGNGRNYLTWKDFRFGSDSITTSFRYAKYKHILAEVSQIVPDYKAFIENFINKTYTIGGSIIFPKENSLNGARGINHTIKDRWDLTLECIRLYYTGEKSPLFSALEKNKNFFDLFVDFKGYVDFFYLQDCVSADYNSVDFWIGNGDFSKSPLPETASDYLIWINRQLDFVLRRNKRIASSAQNLS